jgi:hypothetical protein
MSQLMKIIYSLQKWILTILGDIKCFSYPGWFVFDAKGYKLKGDSFDLVSKKVKKYDVFLNRYDNFLDVGFIPGFWNHAGIVIGANADVNPAVIHAVSDGVLCESLVDTMRSDHFIVLRPKFTVDVKLFEERLRQAKVKEYDFNFDFSNGDKLSCTELVDFMYTGMFPGFRRSLDFLGRKAIFPDDIAISDYFEVIVEIRNDK